MHQTVGNINEVIIKVTEKFKVLKEEAIPGLDKVYQEFSKYYRRMDPLKKDLLGFDEMSQWWQDADQLTRFLELYADITDPDLF